MTTSLLHAALSNHQAYEVGMNEVQFLPFTPSGIRAIGTQNLNGCTAVAIVSPFGAILAHIPPIPYPTTDPNVGIANLQAKMATVLSYYDQHPTIFPPGSTSLVAGATIEGEIALEHHIIYIRQTLVQRQLTQHFAIYTVTLGGHGTPAQGTVFIDARQGQGTPQVYVEDRRVI
ncbi:hypothetical protein DTO063F5_3798 [Paecilomyces variotii]|nr:hypothetical protein DTO063F5_3798 [Paecilomyces variotii]